MRYDQRTSAGALAGQSRSVGDIAVCEGGVRAVHVEAPHDGVPVGPVLSDLGWSVACVPDAVQALAAIGREPVDVVLVDARAHDEVPEELCGLVETAVRRHIAAIILGDAKAVDATGGSTLVTRIPASVSSDELRGRLAMVERYHAMIRGMDRELARMQQLTDRLNDHFREIDDEMQLAGRLQHDFLPDLSEPMRGVRFASVYRPATWVSGDMFDVFRIDEHHTGVYLADAVGHGMAAGLLTMFIKRVIVPKRIHAYGYDVVGPSEVLATLNDALAGQALPNCQFVTACYGVIDHRASTFTFARGGHPYPLHLAADGTVQELTTSGSLLGLFGGAEFAERTIDLNPGDRVLLFTDGIEHVLPRSEADSTSLVDRIQAFLGSTMAGRLHEAFTAIESALDASFDGQAPKDDLTLLAFEMTGGRA